MSCTAYRSISKLFIIFIVLLCKFDSDSNSNSKEDNCIPENIFINGKLFPNSNISMNGKAEKDKLKLYNLFIHRVLQQHFICSADTIINFNT